MDINSLNINGLQQNNAMTTAVVPAQGLKVKCLQSEKSFQLFLSMRNSSKQKLQDKNVHILFILHNYNKLFSD